VRSCSLSKSAGCWGRRYGDWAKRANGRGEKLGAPDGLRRAGFEPRYRAWCRRRYRIALNASWWSESQRANQSPDTAQNRRGFPSCSKRCHRRAEFFALPSWAPRRGHSPGRPFNHALEVGLASEAALHGCRSLVACVTPVLPVCWWFLCPHHGRPSKQNWEQHSHWRSQ
jgi:hypothetical protein